jgi:two-component system, cell cycle sensor histidine kinase and response regulator CckA
MDSRSSSRREARQDRKSGPERKHEMRVAQGRRALEVQAALYQISEAANSAEDLESLYRELHAIVARLMPAENFYIALFNEAESTLSYPYYVDQVDTPPDGPEPLGHGLTAYVLRTGRPLLATPEVFADLMASGEVEVVGAPSLDWLGVPLKVQDRAIGVLAVQSYTGTVRYGEGELDLLEYVSTQVAQAIARKRAQHETRESQRMLATLMSNLPGMVYRSLNDAEWTMVFVSEGSLELTGYHPDELVGNARVSYEEVTHPDDRARLRQEIGSALQESRPYEFTYRIRTASGLTKWVWERGRGVLGRDGEVQALEGFVADVTATREATEALRQSEERYRLALQATQEIMYDWDIATGRIIWNPNVQKVLGYTLQEFGDTLEAWDTFIHPGDRDRVTFELEAAVAGRDAFETEYRFRRKTGDYALIYDRGLILRDRSGAAVRMVGAMSDQTAHRDLELQLRQSQKMEAVGQLAGGVAHDFNNLLTAILGSTELLQRRLGPEDSAQDELATIHRACERAADLTQGLLAYARRQVLATADLDLNEVIEQALPLLRRVIPENIEITFAAGHGLGAVRGDRGQLTQIILNLCVNAKDAMPGGGWIAIRTDDATTRPGRGDEGESAAETRHVRLTVSDNGQGIPPEDLPHVFEPFFTTKELGQGTGMGLSVVYGIVQQHGGAIHLTSRPGQGTTVTIHLPAGSATLPGLQGGPPLPARTGGETVLIVEDENEVRAILKQILIGLGYLVLEASDGREALQILTERILEVDLVITDVVMPNLGGKELYHAVRDLGGGPAFLFSSGYAESLVHEGLADDDTVAFIGKPYGIDALAREVRAVLDARGKKD